MPVSNLLFNPNLNRFISKLDDEKSMFSIALRDGVDNAGRTYQEFKRSEHGGRERFIEEILTMIIWGFGINFMKHKVYDPLAKKVLKLSHPDADLGVLKKLAPETIEKFEQQFPGHYKDITQTIAGKGFQKAQASSIAKFIIATGIPVFMIGFGIPTLNQWLTKRKLEAAQQNGTQQKNPVDNRPLPTDTIALSPTFQKPNLFQHFETTSSSPFALNPLALNQPKTLSPQFSGAASLLNLIGNGTSNILQNERINTLLVDGVISGGRTYKARNWIERAEIIFRESTIVFFLYFAQRPIQSAIGKLFTKGSNSFYTIPFNVLKTLKNGLKENPAEFSSKLTQSIEHLTPALKANDVAENALEKTIQNYFLTGKTDNLILESAKAAHWIPTFTTKTAGSKTKTALLDITRKIQSEPIIHLTQDLQKMVSQSGVEKLAPEALEKVINKSMASRFGAMIAANAVCALFLSYICPKIQHYITYKKTGKNYFPGV